MDTIIDQQGRTLLFPNRYYPTAYLVPSEEKARQIEKSCDNSQFYAAIIFFIITPFFFAFNALEGFKHLFGNYFGQNFDVQKNFEAFPWIIAIFLYFMLEKARISWMTRNFSRISLFDGIQELARQKGSVLSIIFEVVIFIFPLTIFLWQTKRFFLEETSYFILGIAFIISSIVIYYFLKKMVIDIIIIYFKIRQSRKTPVQ